MLGHAPGNNAAAKVEMPRSSIDPDLVDRVLQPYLPECRYLKSAEIEEVGPNKYVGIAQFVVSNSCYIESTGHVNAVETNICLNQLAYLVFANFLSQGDKLSKHDFYSHLDRFGMNNFWELQLRRMHIISLTTKFRKEIAAGQFTGVLSWDRTSSKRDLLLLGGSFRFFDGERPAHFGDILISVPR